MPQKVRERAFLFEKVYYMMICIIQENEKKDKPEFTQTKNRPIDIFLYFLYNRLLILKPEGVKKEMAYVTIDDSEHLEKALKRFKRQVEKEGIIREWKKKEFYEKPSTVLNRKNKALRRKLMKKTRRSRDSKSY